MYDFDSLIDDDGGRPDEEKCKKTKVQRKITGQRKTKLQTKAKVQTNTKVQIKTKVEKERRKVNMFFSIYTRTFTSIYIVLLYHVHG